MKVILIVGQEKETRTAYEVMKDEQSSGYYTSYSAMAVEMLKLSGVYEENDKLDNCIRGITVALEMYNDIPMKDCKLAIEGADNDGLDYCYIGCPSMTVANKLVDFCKIALVEYKIVEA